MHWDFTPYVLPVIASAGISAAVACASWHRRPAPGAVSFCLLMLAVAEWSLAYALELVSSDLPTILFWDNIEWLGAAIAPTLWLAFALQYTGRARWLTRRTVAFLAVEPLVTILLVWTNQVHHLVDSNIGLDRSGPFLALSVTYGTGSISTTLTSCSLPVPSYSGCSFRSLSVRPACTADRPAAC